VQNSFGRKDFTVTGISSAFLPVRELVFWADRVGHKEIVHRVSVKRATSGADIVR
jgi:hypothetical protein